MATHATLSEHAIRQGKLWGSAASDWLNIQEPHSAPLWNAVLDLLGAHPSSRLLDAGCGAGGASVLAQSRGIPVAAFDPSESLLALAAPRLAVVKLGELEAIPFPDGAFDLSMAINSLQFTANPAPALRELNRVTKDRIAIAVWGPPSENDIQRVFEAVVALFPKRPSGQGAFALSQPGLLEHHLMEAGLTIQKDEELAGAFDYPDLSTALRGQMSAGPSQRAAEILGPDKVRAAIEGALFSLRQPAGSIRMSYVFRILVVGAGA
jgi:SAM-dependent methyltransferase